MKVLIFSDIHGFDTNIDYFKNLDKEENFDLIVVLGDVLEPGYGSIYDINYKPDKVKEFLNNILDKLIIIKGNRDFDKEFNYLEGPIEKEIDGHKFILYHGHESFNILDDNVILICGHYHIPFIKRENNNINICVGSVSLPKEDKIYSYGIYENHKFTLYNFKKEIIDYIEL